MSLDPTPDAAEPSPDCPICPRLAAFRAANRAMEPGWFNAPVPSWGPRTARLLVVGLAPGLRGANRTGRPFTGDHAGMLLYATLAKFGLATGTYDARPDDGFQLTGCRVVNAVRCVPPENKPQPAEIRACNNFLRAELAAMPDLRGILALGVIAHEAVLRARGARVAAYRFSHSTTHALPDDLVVTDSYHVSRYNTNTGRLTQAMFETAVSSLVERIGQNAGVTSK